MSMLETKGLCKNYGSNNVLSNVDLRIDKGEFEHERIFVPDKCRDVLSDRGSGAGLYHGHVLCLSDQELSRRHQAWHG